MPSVGDTYTLSGQIKTGSAPGQSQYTLDPGQQVKIIGQRNVGGQLYYDVQHVGGGTGWTPASSFQANQLQAPVNVPLSSGANQQSILGLQGEVDAANKRLQEILAGQSAENKAQLEVARKKEAGALESIKGAAGEIRTGIETEFAKLEPGITADFGKRRALTGRLEELLTEGQEYIRQQKEVTGLAAVRNPRIQRAIEDVAAEAGIVQATISAYDGNISQAFNIINGKMNVIVTSRQEELNYYKTVLNLANRDIISLDEDSKRIANEQVKIAETFLNNALDISNYVSKLLANPATAGLMDGVKLTDSIEAIQQKVSQNSYNKEVSELVNAMVAEGNTLVYDPASVPASQLITLTDARGGQHYFKKEPKTMTTSQKVDTFIKNQGAGGGVGTTSRSHPGSVAGAYRIGDLWVDPKTGAIWEYSSSGWVRRM